MTAQSIRDAALFHFARDGYEGASLRAIADEVGIKKPSIYAHFSCKDDLFLHTILRTFVGNARWQWFIGLIEHDGDEP